MKFLILFSVLSVNAMADAQDPRYTCNYNGQRSCDGKELGQACAPTHGGRGYCILTAVTAGEFCLCKPVQTPPQPVPQQDPCDRRPLPRHCM